MADAEPPGGHPQQRSGLRRAADELDLRHRARRAVDYHIRERNPVPEARAERLEHSLLGGEPPGQALDPIGPMADLVELDLDEATRNERVARIFNPAPNLGDLYEVNAVSDDVHKTRLSFEPSTPKRAQ
jgi:hypothetical protein